MALNWISVRDFSTSQFSNDPVLAERLDELKDEKLTDSKALSTFNVYQRQYQRDASASVRISPFFKGDGNYKDFAYSYFAGAFSDNMRYTGGENNSIIAERFGLGIEISLAISEIKTPLRGGFGMIAAAVDMGLAKVEYSYHIHALPEGDYRDLLPQMGQFNGDAIENFKKMVSKLKLAYKNDLSNTDLVAMEVLLSRPVPEEGTENARSYYFACRKIMDKKSLKMAIEESRTRNLDLNEDAIQYIYSRVGMHSIEEIPGAQSIAQAKNLIHL